VTVSLLVDVFDDFGHEHGGQLLDSFLARLGGMRQLLSRARERDLAIERLVLAGMTAEGCVAQTAIAGGEKGFKVTVVPSACATIDPELERIALAYLERVVGVQLAQPDVERGSFRPRSSEVRVSCRPPRVSNATRVPE